MVVTVVNLRGLATALEAPVPIENGTITVTYWAGSKPYINVAGADVTFPARIAVRITDGEPVAPLDLTPTGDVCCVRWDIGVAKGGHRFVRYTTIPEDGPVDFGDLEVVDRNPLTPNPPASLLEQIAQIVIEQTRDRW
mgnify:CR=1 FL=1